MCQRSHWILIELQLSSFKVVVYDSYNGYTTDKELEELIVPKLEQHLPTYLHAIRYWEMLGNKNPQTIHIKVSREKSVPQQAGSDKVSRGDCGVFVCMFMEHLCLKHEKPKLPLGVPNSAAAGLAYRHYMAGVIYSRRILPSDFKDPN